MDDVETRLAATREAVRELQGAADACAAGWTDPCAPGKWSPSQIVEHVARALEESAHVAAGEPSKLPKAPSVFRPVIRVLFFNRVLKRGTIPRARTNSAMNPASGPATPAEGRTRLEGALARFEAACRARSVSGRPVESKIFGRVPVADYARFQEVHTRHHRRQMPDVR